MPELSRSQLLVYGAVAIALLLLGARWIHSGNGDSTQSGDVTFGADSFEPSKDGSRDVVVDVAGEVRKPGVYRMPAGSRVTDAIDRAGGLTAAAGAEAINRAARLSDGQQVVVPAANAAASGAGSGASATQDGPISLGSATVEDLDTIEGIGPVTAQDIIDFRDQHGGIGSIDQLNQVSGIGPATMEALRARLQP